MQMNTFYLFYLVMLHLATVIYFMLFEWMNERAMI